MYQVCGQVVLLLTAVTSSHNYVAPARVDGWYVVVDGRLSADRRDDPIPSLRRRSF